MAIGPREIERKFHAPRSGDRGSLRKRREEATLRGVAVKYGPSHKKRNIDVG
jgi:hypothetical protein